MYVLYNEHSIISGPDQNGIYQVTEYLKKSELYVTVEGNIDEWIEVKI